MAASKARPPYCSGDLNTGSTQVSANQVASTSFCAAPSTMRYSATMASRGRPGVPASSCAKKRSARKIGPANSVGQKHKNSSTCGKGRTLLGCRATITK